MSELIKEVNHGEREKRKEILMCAYFKIWAPEGTIPRPICTYLGIDYKGYGLVLNCCNPFPPLILKNHLFTAHFSELLSEKSIVNQRNLREKCIANSILSLCWKLLT